MRTHNAEFEDARLVAIYDAEFAEVPADNYFIEEIGAEPVRVLDLGCGTGRLATALAARGHVVTGVDPAGSSLAAARRRPGADRVTWVLGTARRLPDATFDVAVLTSHVAQFFVADRDWVDVLSALHRAVVPGGRLVFDSRNPEYRAWEHWNRAESQREVTMPGGTVVRTWTEVTGVRDDVVSYTRTFAFPAECLVSSSVLRFRSQKRLHSALEAAGWRVTAAYGDGHRAPVAPENPELILVASRS